MKKILYTSCFLLAANFAVGQNRAAIFEAYIEAYSDIAVEKMREHGIPASITLSQGLLESGAGRSRLAIEANNHFGIKCHNWTGATIHHDDDEEQECFRKYEHAEQSFEDHSLFLTTRSRYAFLFELDKTDYKAWAHGLSRAGYATCPNYPTRLINIIEEFNLHRFDKKALEKPTNNHLIEEKVENIPPKKQTTARSKAVDTKPPPARTQNNNAPATNPVQSAPKTVEVAQNQTQSTTTANRGTARVFQSDRMIGQVNPYFAHEIRQNNGVQYVIATENDTFENIAERFGLKIREIYNINDAVNPSRLRAGEKVYLRQKKTASSRTAFHTVTEGETMRDISQQHGVRLNSLYKRNNMTEGAKPTIGQRIMLK